MIPVTIYIFLLIELVGVSIIDIKQKKISNYWVLINVTIFVILLFLQPGFYTFQSNTFIYPITFISVGFILFVLKVMGAGDAKYLFSFFLLVPRSLHDHFFVTLLWMTIIIGLSSLTVNLIQNLSIITNAFKNSEIGKIKGVFGKKFSYAPVILLSWGWIGYIFKQEIFGIYK